MVHRNDSIAEEEDIYTDNLPDTSNPSAGKHNQPPQARIAWGENLISSSSSQDNSLEDGPKSVGFVPVTTSNTSGSHMTSHPRIVPSRVDVVRAQFRDVNISPQHREREMTKVEFER